MCIRRNNPVGLDSVDSNTLRSNQKKNISPFLNKLNINSTEQSEFTSRSFLAKQIKLIDFKLISINPFL